MARSRPARPGDHNLPAQRTALVGRDRDITSLCHLLMQAEGRLVTLTGIGGCGKTRLALGVAANLVDSFPEGVWLVALAPLADPLLVTQAVASVLGVREQPDRSLLDVLAAHLARRELLLLLDNCEHLVQTCAELADTLLQGCPGVRLLATSREPLHISGELAWRVPPLAIPDPGSALGSQELARYPAVALFAERAAAAQADFALAPHNATAVAAICARLEGLPLAIELAAAWVRALGVGQILERLDDTFELLVGGNRTAPSRQQTMRATLDWSHGLLSEHERVVFRRLAVFTGGWGLEAAEVVCSGSETKSRDVLSLLTRLVDGSLVQVEERDGRARYRLLEPVRQYARELLVASAELDALRRQHAVFYLDFAQQLESDANAGGPGREAAHAALEQELENLRTAMRWCVEHGAAQMGLRLGRAHWNLWVVRGRFTEGQAWLTQMAALPAAGEAPTMRAVALSITASLAWRQGSYAQALDIYAVALPLLRQGNDPWLLYCALADLGCIALYQGDYEAARAYFDESLGAARAAGDRPSEAMSLTNLGWLASVQADFPTARAQCEASLALARAVGDAWVEGDSLNFLGHAALLQGDLVTARQRLEESVVVNRRIGERYGLAYALDGLGQVARVEGHYAEARSELHESLRLHEQLGDRAGMAESLESIAALAAALNLPERAMQLAGAAAGVRETIGARLSPVGRATLDRWLVPVRQAVGDEASVRAWEAGRTYPLERVLELALAAAERPASPTKQPPGRSGQQGKALSRRELEVAHCSRAD
jgi:predicted ATPase